MLKVIFYLKSEKADKNGECSIFARITYKTNRISLSTGKTISKERWVYTNNLRNLLRLEREKVLKNYLELYRLNVEKKFNLSMLYLCICLAQFIFRKLKHLKINLTY